MESPPLSPPIIVFPHSSSLIANLSDKCATCAQSTCPLRGSARHDDAAQTCPGAERGTRRVSSPSTSMPRSSRCLIIDGKSVTSGSFTENGLRHSSVTMNTKKTRRLWLWPALFIAVVLCLDLHHADAMFVSCPSGPQLTSLIGHGDRSESGLVCDCSSDPSPTTIGWEVNCVRKASSKASVSTLENHDEIPADYYSVDVPLGFSVRYVQGKLIEITCDDSSPDFKAAMFQGMFGALQHSFP